MPVSTYTRIQSHCGKQPFGEDVVQRLFETRVRQRIETGACDDEDMDLGTLDWREVGGLFSDIRAADRRKMGGYP